MNAAVGCRVNGTNKLSRLLRARHGVQSDASVQRTKRGQRLSVVVTVSALIRAATFCAIVAVV